jgi:hypothetical protein
MIMNAASRAGFIKIDENGNRSYGEGGCEGFLGWLSLWSQCVTI